MSDAWRKGYNTGSAFRQEVDAIIADALARENAKGASKYGPDFVGDPMTQAVEELIGGIRYLATELARVKGRETVCGAWLGRNPDTGEPRHACGLVKGHQESCRPVPRGAPVVS